MSSTSRSLTETIAVGASIATIVGTCIAALALIPAFGQWLHPNDERQEIIPPETVGISATPQWVQQLATNPILAGNGLAGVELGYQESKVIQVLGNPNETYEARDKNNTPRFDFLSYNYRDVGLAIYISKENRTVWGFRLTDGNFNKDGLLPYIQGITVGDPEAQVLRAFGQPLRITPVTWSDSEIIELVYEGVSFHLCIPGRLVCAIHIPDWR